MTKKKKTKKKLGPFLLLCSSFLVIIFTTFTIFKYWTEIYNKYQENYIARYAREKYFYSKDGEYILKIPDDD